MGNLIFVPTIRVALGLFTRPPNFTGFMGIVDGISCSPVPTLGLLVFIMGSGDGLLGLTLGDLFGML